MACLWLNGHIYYCLLSCELFRDTLKKPKSTTAVEELNVCIVAKTRVTSVSESTAQDCKCRGKRERSAVWRLSLSVFILRCHNNLMDVICSASTSPRMLFYFPGKVRWTAGLTGAIHMKSEWCGIQITVDPPEHLAFRTTLRCNMLLFSHYTFYNVSPVINCQDHSC